MKRHLLFLLFALCFFQSVHAKTNTQTSYVSKFIIEAPAGFDSLAAQGETVIDLYVDGKKIGETTAKFNAKTITFSTPSSIVSLMSTVRDHERIINSLSKPLATNKHFVCGNNISVKKNSQICGYIQPDVVAVIFDIDNLRADLFVNQLYTYTRDKRARFLPPPTISPGLLSSLNLRSVNSLNTKNSYFNGMLRTIAGAGRWSVDTQIIGNDKGKTSLTAATINYQGKNTELAIGSLPYRSGSRLARSSSIIGFRISSSLKTWLNKSSIQGVEIPINVTSKAQVEVYRDGKRIDVQIIEPRQKIINTTRFPRGSYDITLKITELGVAREELRFYTQSSMLPPSGVPQWYFEVGKSSYYRLATDFLPSFKHEPLVFKVGYLTRISSNFGFSSHFSLSESNKYSELSIFKVGSKYSLKTGLIGSDNGDVGAYLSARRSGKKWSVSVRYTHLKVKDPHTIISADQFRPFTRSYKRSNISAAYYFKKGKVGLRANHYQYNNGTERFSTGPYVNYDLFNNKRSRLSLSARKIFSNHSQASYIGLNFTTFLGSNQSRANSKVRDRVQSRANVYTRKNIKTNNTVSRLSAESSISRSIRNADGHQNQYSVGVIRSDGNTDIKAGIRKSLNFATTSANLSSYDNGKSNRLITNLTTGVAIGRGYVLPLTRYQKSGSFVDIKGASNSQFNVLVNGSKRKVTQSNTPVFIPLSSNRIYDVSVSATDVSDIEYDESANRIVVYPGNIPVIKRQASNVSIVIGQVLLLTNNQSVRLANIKGKMDLGVTDENGYFQIDYRDQKILDLYKNNKKICSLDIQKAVTQAIKEDDYVDVGSVNCF